MLFYNREAGKLLKKSGQGVLRRHSQPNLERLEAFQKSNIPELEKFAYSSAEYCLSSESETVHYGLETDAYAHASSPIRRYADLVNQRILKELIMSFEEYTIPIDYRLMNRRGKAIKRYGRDMDFLKAISTGETRFKAVIVEQKMIYPDKKKIKLYVPKWGRMVSTWFKSLSYIHDKSETMVRSSVNDETYLKSKSSSAMAEDSDLKSKSSLAADNIVLSRDESREIDVTLYREVDIECVFMPNARNWKERAIINII
jgi:exoribonuclease II